MKRTIIPTAAALLVVTSLVACQDESPVGPPPMGPADVILRPGDVTFFTIGDTLTFSARPVNADGEDLDIEVEWRSEDPSVFAVDSRSGEAISVGNGTAEVVAIADSEQRRAAVVVSASVVNAAWVLELDQSDPSAANDTASVSATVHAEGRR